MSTRLTHILVEGLVHRDLPLVAVGDHADESERDVIACNLCPVDVSLPLGDADSAHQNAVNRVARCVDILPVDLVPCLVCDEG